MSELEDVEIETIQNKTQREKGPKKKKNRVSMSYVEISRN